MPGTEKKQTELQGMLMEGKHPVLKQLRRQVFFESLLFTLFLVLYYDMFDGDRKPLWLNALLAGGVLLVIVHGVLGYVHARRTIRGANLREALAARVKELKIFAALSVGFRVLGMVCILLFFGYAVTFTLEKQVLITGAVLIVLLQFGLLANIWLRRIRWLGRVAGELGEG